MGRRRIDITGMKFSKLTAIKDVGCNIRGKSSRNKEEFLNRIAKIYEYSISNRGVV